MHSGKMCISTNKWATMSALNIMFIFPSRHHIVYDVYMIVEGDKITYQNAIFTVYRYIYISTLLICYLSDYKVIKGTGTCPCMYMYISICTSMLCKVY